MKAGLFSLALVAALGSSPAHAQLSPAFRAADRREAECLVRNIERLDDGMSPAADVAMAAQVHCRHEHAAYVAAFFGAHDPATDPETRAKLDAISSEAAIRWVLEARAVRRERAIR